MYPNQKERSKTISVADDITLCVEAPKPHTHTHSHTHLLPETHTDMHSCAHRHTLTQRCTHTTAKSNKSMTITGYKIDMHKAVVFSTLTLHYLKRNQETNLMYDSTKNNEIHRNQLNQTG
jgi:hypothetical protein